MRGGAAGYAPETPWGRRTSVAIWAAHETDRSLLLVGSVGLLSRSRKGAVGSIPTRFSIFTLATSVKMVYVVLVSRERLVLLDRSYPWRAWVGDMFCRRSESGLARREDHVSEATKRPPRSGNREHW